MCGRYTLKTDPASLARLFALPGVPDFGPRYNIAPTQPVLVIRAGAPGGRCIDWMRWGLIPSWAKDPAIGAKLINARSETLLEKPSFRTAYRRRRCLVPADGYYEWQQQEKGKQPYHFTLPSGKIFAFAGLWDDWLGADGSEVETVTLVTTAANDLIRPYHDRMPVIVTPSQWDLWLDPRMQDPQRLAPVLAAANGLRVLAKPANRRVGQPRCEGPDLLVPDPPRAAPAPEAPSSGTQLSLLDL